MTKQLHSSNDSQRGAIEGRSPNGRERAALRLSLWIHLTVFALGVAVFTAISVQAGTGEYVMLWPLVWWSIGVLGHVAAVIIAELVARFERHR
jgi:2TM domain